MKIAIMTSLPTKRDMEVEMHRIKVRKSNNLANLDSAFDLQGIEYERYQLNQSV
jgi:hypothetical protein